MQTQVEKNGPLMALAEAKQRLGLARATIIKLGKNREIPGYVHVGGRHFFKRRVLLDWLEDVGERA